LKTKLQDLKITEGSLCKKGANPLAKIMLFKSADGEVERVSIKDRVKQIWKALTFNEVLDSKEADRDWWEITSAFEQSVKSILDDKGNVNKSSMLIDTCTQFVEAAKPIIPRLTEPIYLSAEGTVTAIEAITEDVTKAGKTISSANMQRLQAAMMAIKEIMGQMMEGEPPNNSVMDNDKSSKKVTKGDDYMELQDVLKVLPKEQQEVISKAIEKAASEAINKQVDVAAISKAVEEKFSEQLKKQAEDNEKLQKALDAEKDLRITKEFISKAAEYKNLGTKSDDFGKVLKEIAQKITPETYSELEKVLAGADEKIGKNDLFLKEIGSGGETVLETIDKVNKMVEEIRKSDSKITKEQAEAKVWMEHPELYREYEAEKRQ
jgi:DNA-binding protein